MLEQRIAQDYLSAMKSKDSATSAALSFLRAQLQNARIEKKADALEDADVIAVIKKQVKQRQDSIEQFQKGRRDDLVAKEAAELQVLHRYLPAQMPDSDLERIIDAVIKETGASGIKDMGAVMKAVGTQAAGRADGKTMSALVKQKLSQM